MNEGDKETAGLMLTGDKKAFLKFYRAYQGKLLSYVRVRVKKDEDAEEIVQDAFLGFLDSLPVFSFRSSLWTFLVSITKHEIADYYRKLYAKKAIKMVPFLNQVYDEPLYAEKVTAELFDRALDKLLPEQKELLIWKYDEGLSVKQIAEKMGVGIKAAESKLFRARQAFKNVYAEFEEADEK